MHGRLLEPGVYGDNTWDCPAENVLPTLLPGLLNLGAFLWLLSPHRGARLAGLTAGSLGAARLVVPGLIYLALGTVSLRTTFWPGPNESVIASVVLWGLSLIAAVAFPRLAARAGA
ncbi:MAG TPA: hypothetical protein VFT91_04555 [Dehalococcoidia bacterium]|nr:hypothetical protein [Dehalococcoidia bacterium]